MKKIINYILIIFTVITLGSCAAKFQHINLGSQKALHYMSVNGEVVFAKSKTINFYLDKSINSEVKKYVEEVINIINNNFNNKVIKIVNNPNSANKIDIVDYQTYQSKVSKATLFQNAMTVYTTRANVIVKSHIYMLKKTLLNSNKIYFQTVLLHEIGHCLGLKHSKNKTSVMYPYYNGSSKIKIFNANEIEALKAVYNE